MIELAEEKKNLAYIKAQELLTEAATVEDFASFSKSNTDSVEVEVTIGKMIWKRLSKKLHLH